MIVPILLNKLKTFTQGAILLCFLFGTLTIRMSGAAQSSAVAIPNLIGLSVPEAAARLHQVGLNLGVTSARQWSATANSEAQRDTILMQNPATGTNAAQDTAVNLEVWRSEIAVLLYDTNEITLQNPSGVDLSLRRVIFRSLNSQTSAEFVATEWANRIRAGECLQLWTVRRDGAKAVEGCSVIREWLSRSVASAHFWTGTNGATQFEVVQDGVQRGVCEIAAGRCEVYIAPVEGKSGVASDVSDYLTLVYTPDILLLVNQAADRWLPFQDVTLNGIYAYNEKVLYPNRALAGHECIVWTVTITAPAIPIECIVIQQYVAAENDIFWQAPFNVTSTVDGAPHECSAAAEGEVSLCIVPRLREVE